MNTRLCGHCDQEREEWEYSPSAWTEPGHYKIKCRHCKKADRKVKPGYVYVITNPAFRGWVKIGRTNNLDQRLQSYQTGSPYRDYKYEYNEYVENTDPYEDVFKLFKGKNEWSEMSANAAILIIKNIVL